MLFANEAYKLLIDASSDLVENLDSTIIFAFFNLLESLLENFYRHVGDGFENETCTFLSNFSDLFLDKLFYLGSLKFNNYCGVCFIFFLTAYGHLKVRCMFICFCTFLRLLP